MKKASVIAFLITTSFYLCCGCFSHAAVGINPPRSLLTGFELFRTHGILDFACACIILHLWVGYQLYSQPVLATLEGWILKRFLHTDFINKIYKLDPPLLPAILLNPPSGSLLLFPYFNSIQLGQRDLVSRHIHRIC